MTASNITSDQNQYSLQVKFLQADPFTIAKGDMSVCRLLGFLSAYILLQFHPNSPFTVIRFIVYLLFCLLSLALSNVFLILVCLFSCSFSLSQLFLFTLIPLHFRVTAYSIIFSSLYFVSLPRCAYFRSEKLYLYLLIWFVVCIFLTDCIFSRFYVSFLIYFSHHFGDLKKKNPFRGTDK